MKKLFFLGAILIAIAIQTCACDDQTRIVPDKQEELKGGYLFAHMKHEDYGGIYYYVSKDAKQWVVLNDNKTVEPKYSGHPDIITGRDGRYYMIGVSRTQPKGLELWASSDLLSWSVVCPIPDQAIFNTPGYKPDGWYSAPKLYFDVASDQYIISWHASKISVGEGGATWWDEMRTFYMLTKDFITYSTPQRLFDFKSDAFKDAATIDAIIRKIGDSYYAIWKDERSNDIAETGKTILISKSKNLTGPYSEPGEPVTPKTEAGKSDKWHEAPALVEQPDGKGWYIFAERYPNEYVRFDAPDIESPSWKQHVIGIPDSRHGCMVRITDEQYDALIEKYGF